MFKIIKVLNNNAIQALDQSQSKEVVFLGKGIGFSAKEQAVFSALPNAKAYYFEQQSSKGVSKDLLETINPLYLEISSLILEKAEEKFHQVDGNILLPLADHIAFAIQRMNQNLDIRNPFAHDIRLLFPEEYEIACYGKDIILEKCGKSINEDEVGYITLHIHSSIDDENVATSMQTAIIIQEMIARVEKDFKMTINQNSLSYGRLLTHIKYMLLRIKKGESLHLDMEDYVKTNLPYAYEVASNIIEEIEKTIQKKFAKTETGYLALHIERIRQDTLA